MRRANLLTVSLDDVIDAAGFRHIGTSLTARLGSERLRPWIAEPGDHDCSGHLSDSVAPEPA